MDDVPKEECSLRSDVNESTVLYAFYFSDWELVDMFLPIRQTRVPIINFAALHLCSFTVHVAFDLPTFNSENCYSGALKIRRDREKAKEEKRKRREEKQKRREKKKMIDQIMNMSCNVEKDCSMKIVRVDTNDGFEHLEKSSLTEEYGLPTCLCIPTSSETECIENSSKRKRHSCPINGDITRLLFEVKKQKKQDTLYNEDRTDILPQHKDETFCYISEGTGNIGRGFPQTDEAINHLISKLLLKAKEELDLLTIASLTSLQRVASQYKNLYENWVPLLLQAVHPDPDDEDWFFQRKSRDVHSENRLKSCSNSISTSCSSTLSCHAQLLPGTDIYALPFTVPF
ncbi:Uncharacterized protein Adt_24857 [Abeliophyllum distichum]|uniref:Uncharacterized protein n=1 Tax=Abeliophyllum distichum TaxID=126358 RepID=A0ABD1SEZ1_9LAMI